MGLFDSIKLYQSEWTEVNHRKFTPEECNAVQAASVVASKYGKSVCFMFANGKRFIPLEPTCNATIGDVLNVKDLTVVALHYTGTNTNQTVTDVLRVRIEQEEQPAVTFDNPFGL